MSSYKEESYDTYDDFLRPTPATLQSSNHLQTVSLIHNEQLLEQHHIQRKLEHERDQLREQQRQQQRRAAEEKRDKWRSYFGDRKQRWVFGIFAVLVCLGLLLFFFIPRVPGVNWANENDLESFTANAGFQADYSTSPASFAFSANISIQVDSSSSWIPYKMTSLQATVLDLSSSEIIGTGGYPYNAISLPARGKRNVMIPISFLGTYTSTNSTTYGDVIRACTANTTSTLLPIGISLTFKIQGVIGTKIAKLQSTRTTCPVELELKT
ncbi:BZ3500_MvSof-1268-A1-R1_Chr10-1g02742 [Microbotryum saponariae]|uniref:BZ3500_MvSof-1268-A1-R1_Chr10-1g02742 protein n=1 Tax=Microbotryum saponariae TaxID=289078 RepID=A0A2X0L4J6_9BASI|nr:BZ3500_MvSof-1268-A1-R1_Chr10-1g02742 [Microbotryum saponariae]SDA06231.1 BZ3501_MvSof-1269-A2-R1_Chr10-1g02343 [Microbotryum saponariae]